MSMKYWKPIKYSWRKVRKRWNVVAGSQFLAYYESKVQRTKSFLWNYRFRSIFNNIRWKISTVAGVHGMWAPGRIPTQVLGTRVPRLPVWKPASVILQFLHQLYNFVSNLTIVRTTAEYFWNNVWRVLVIIGRDQTQLRFAVSIWNFLRTVAVSSNWRNLSRTKHVLFRSNIRREGQRMRVVAWWHYRGRCFV